MRAFILIFLLSFSLFRGSFAFALVLPPLPHQAVLIKGLQIIDQGQWSLGERFISNATGTLGGRVFYWLKYSSESKNNNFEWYRISRFIKSHKNWPDLRAMQTNAENVMPADLSHKEIVKWFTSFPPVTSTGRLKNLDALLSMGQYQIFKARLRMYWTSHMFGQEAQEKFIRKYKKDLSHSLHKKRLSFLLAHEYYETALHLSSYMGAGEKALVVAVTALSGSQKNVNALIQKVPKSLQNHPALVYARMKWRRKKSMNAGVVALLNRAPSLENWAVPYAWWKERHVIIRRLIEEKNYPEAYRLASHHKQKEGLGLSEAEFMAGWLALRFVNKPHQALQHFQILYKKVKTPISKSRGAYWAGRAALKTGDRDKAQQWFKVAAYQKTTYYGQIAMDSLKDMNGKNVHIKSYPPIQIEDSLWDKWVSDDRVTVMRLLYHAGQEERALQFLAKMLNDPKNKAPDFMALSKITRLMGFHMGEVKTAKKAAYRSVILTEGRGMDLGYPVLDLKENHKNIGLPHIHAIIRQESEFNPKAESSAGAKGYMQLMPATAKSTARSLKIKHQTSWLILRPTHNIRLGSMYLESLMEQYKGTLALSAAAYNAGPHRVQKWIKLFGDPRSPDVDMIDWIELIPFSETRNYVQRVSEAEFIYRHK